MPPTYFPLRWESTGDQWWYASPIDWAAANGHYDLVRELLRIDSNHLISLTSLRRIRRLETVWDDEEQFDDVAKCRSQVARELFRECESKKGKNSLIHSGYGGWLMYTAASAGDLNFVQELLERNSLLVFGEGEYGVTDIFYAAARSKSSDVFRLIYDYAVSPRFLAAKGGGLEEHIGEIPSVYKLEMTNRAVHAASRGGNLTILKDLLSNCADVLAYRDTQGSTILHAAASRGQDEVVKYLVSSFDIINSTDHLGNTALHIAAYRGHLAVVEALIVACPSLTSSKNNAGETFLHMVVSGFQNPAFRRLDRQIELMRKLIAGENFNIGDIINEKNNDRRTALHTAIIGNIHTELVQLLMSAQSINVNVRDADGMTALDLLRERPCSVSSDILIRQLISAGGIFGCQDYSARRAIASRLKMQGTIGSPGTSFRVSDAEILLYTGVEIVSDGSAEPASVGISYSSPDVEVAIETPGKAGHRKRNSVNYAAEKLKRALQWPRPKENKSERFQKASDQGSVESYKKCSSSAETPKPLRQRFSKPTTPTNNKRTLSVRSNQSSPTAKKKLASGIKHGVVQAIPQSTLPGRSHSSSFSKSSISSPTSVEKLKGIFVETDVPGPSSCNELFDNATMNEIEKEGSTRRRSRSQFFCFGASSLSVRTPVSRQRQSLGSNPSILSVY